MFFENLDWRKIRTFVLAAFLAVLVGATPTATAWAAPGDLDRSFGIDGMVTTDFAGGHDVANGIAIQSDNKIVVAGKRYDDIDFDFAIARYNTDGSLDTGFGTDGMVTTEFVGRDDEAVGIVIQSDGKIVVAGYSHNLADDDDFAVVRYNRDGSLDTGFGGDGKVTTDFAGGDDVAYGIAIQSDNKIVVAGKRHDDNDFDFAIARYNADGSPDTSFGTDGMITTNFAAGLDDVAYGISLQSDGKIVVAGYSETTINYDFAVARYNTDGSLDTGFGTNGMVTTDFDAGLTDIAYSISIQSDDKIVVAGESYNDDTNFDLAVACYDTDGGLDTDFGTDGTVTTDFSGGSDTAGGIAFGADGKIVVAGESYNGSNFDFALARYFSGQGSGGSGDNSGCFIATAAYGSPLEPHVEVLREFRDRILLVNKFGKSFVALYYTFSPPAADFIASHSPLRAIVRWSLVPIVGVCWVALKIGLAPTLASIPLVLILIAATLFFFGKRHWERQKKCAGTIRIQPL